MTANLLTCESCREPFVITDCGVTCGCDFPIRGNVSAVIGMDERKARREFPGNFQESPADAMGRQLIARIRRGQCRS